jgi:hypothetical protein
MVAQLDRDYVEMGWGRAARRLASYALFEGRPATTRGQWVNPLVFGLLRTLARTGGAPRVRKPIFITGLGRSGTTILGLLLSLHRDVGFLNEPKALWHVIDSRQDINGNYAGATPRYRLGAADVTPQMRLHSHRIFARYLRGVGARRLVDKYPELVFRLPYVRELFPDAKTIFIYRNGVDACQSIVQWSQRLGREQHGQLEDWWGRNDSKWLNLWRELIQPDPRYADIAAAAPQSIGHADRAALEWIVTMREGLAQDRQAPGTLIKVRYETLVDEPETELMRLLGACDLERDDAIFRYAARRLKASPAKPMPKLTGPVQRWFDETMTALEY